MTILRNKFFWGELRYAPNAGGDIVIQSIYKSNSTGKLLYGVTIKDGSIYRDVPEGDIYESKEAYEAEQNQIRVGDEYYLMVSSPCDIRKLKANEITEFFIDGISIKWCFKTKELLLQAVQKAVEECE